MRPQKEYEEVLELLDRGLNDCEVSRRTGVPRGTVRDWRVGREAGSPGRTKFATGSQPSSLCPVCDGRWLDRRAYAYLLGQYLGDGYIVATPRGVYRFSIFCTAAYVDIIDDVAAHIVAVRGRDAVEFVQERGCVRVYSYWKHWPCVFPQHGAGRKHEREITLLPWQEEIVVACPKQFLRGLIQSDGCRHVNPIVRPLKDGPRKYEYTRYMFTNESDDIRRLFTNTCDHLGIGWTQTNRNNVAVSRRADVAFLDTFVGPKS